MGLFESGQIYVDSSEKGEPDSSYKTKENTTMPNNSNIRTQCSNIKSAREKIEKHLNEIQEKVENEIELILDEINIEEEKATNG